MTNNQKSALIFSMLFTLPAVAAEKPNLLFIVTDEHNFRTLGCYRDLLPEDQAEIWGKGNVVETPNLDKIADNGAIFTRMYASSPVSMPARCAMFTGFYGFQLGMANNTTKPGDGRYLHADVPTIAQAIQKEGYATGYIGKIHLAETSSPEEFWEPYPVGHPDYHYGFADYRYMFNGGHGKYLGMKENGDPYFVKSSKASNTIGEDQYGFTLYNDPKNKDGKIMGTTDFLTARTLDFIDKNKENPFYLTLSIPDPHTGDLAVGKYHDMYTDMKIENPKTFYADLGADAPSWQKADGKAEKLQVSVPQYFGMVKNIDDCVGKIIDKLEADGILENTIIVFTSDHGDLMGEHRRMNKGTAHEASARVPFIICHGMKSKKSLVPRGKVVDYVANTTDWMPTFLNLMDIDGPQGVGRDITPLLSNKTPKGWRDLTYTIKSFTTAIEGQYKLTISEFDKKPWLTDLEADPDEVINFIDDPKYNDVIVRLSKDIMEISKKTEINNAKQNAIIKRLIEQNSK